MKLKLLNLAYSCLDANECYVEIGTFVGKSIISAMINNKLRKTFACDNFSQFQDMSSEAILMSNLEKYNLRDKIIFFDTDFRKILTNEIINIPIGLYFYDGTHDFESQYWAIKLVENLLAQEALVIVDDWRYAPDSNSYAKEATIKAIEESIFQYDLLYELPARYNGDHGMWWNGIGVFAFYRKHR